MYLGVTNCFTSFVIRSGQLYTFWRNEDSTKDFSALDFFIFIIFCSIFYNYYRCKLTRNKLSLLYVLEKKKHYFPAISTSAFHITSCILLKSLKYFVTWHHFWHFIFLVGNDFTLITNYFSRGQNITKILLII